LSGKARTLLSFQIREAALKLGGKEESEETIKINEKTIENNRLFKF